MDAIRELQRQLAKAQEVSNVKKISERNCIDLVQKLIELDRVKLVHTTSGKEWLTPEQLDREIRDALASTGGRLGVTDLPAEVGVAIEHVEGRVDLMCKKDGSLTRLQGELLSSQYLDGVSQEVDESLADSGCLAVSDLAVRYNLPADYVRSSVLNKVATPHITKQNSIYTDVHANRVFARARGALRGCTMPVTLAQLAARHRLDADMLADAVQKMLKDGTLFGKLQGSTFTPKIFADAQSSKVDDFYDANKYLPLSVAKSSGVVVKDWAKEKKIEGLTLSTAFVATQLVDPIVATVTESLASGSWIDVMPLLPPSLVIADARELLQHLGKKKHLGDAIVMDHVVASKEFIKSLALGLEEETKKAAERLLSSPAAKSSSKKAAPTNDDDDDDGKKKKKGAKGKKTRADEEEDTGTSSAKSGIENQTIIDLLFDKCSELPADVHEELCGHVQLLLVSMVAEAQKALLSTLQSKSKGQFEEAEKFVQKQYERVYFGLRALEAKKLVSSPLHRHLLREGVEEALHRLLSLRWHEVNGDTIEITSANRRQILDKIIATEGAAKAETLSRLLAAVTGKKDPPKVEKAPKDAKEEKKPKKGKRKDESDDDGEIAAVPETLDGIYHAAASDCHIYCRKVDKKREKSMLQEARADCKEKLKEFTTAGEALEILQDIRKHDRFQQFVREERHVCALAIQSALLHDGVPGMFLPSEVWAMQLVAESLAEDEVREEALKLCAAIDKESKEGAVAPEDDGADEYDLP